MPCVSPTTRYERFGDPVPLRPPEFARPLEPRGLDIDLGAVFSG